ncbi:MAG: hypothetical protein LBV06_09445 [Propionibacteriaceae bacterium]|nr:hypothetical protein [Propionibacteriaceae bacterium]
MPLLLELTSSQWIGSGLLALAFLGLLALAIGTVASHRNHQTERTTGFFKRGLAFWLTCSVLTLLTGVGLILIFVATPDHILQTLRDHFGGIYIGAHIVAIIAVVLVLVKVSRSTTTSGQAGEAVTTARARRTRRRHSTLPQSSLTELAPGSLGHQPTPDRFAALCVILAAIIASLGVFAGLNATNSQESLNNANILSEQYNTALANLGSDSAVIRAGAASTLGTIADNWATWPGLPKADAEAHREVVIRTLIDYLRTTIPTEPTTRAAEENVRDTIAAVFQRHLARSTTPSTQLSPTDPTSKEDETADPPDSCDSLSSRREAALAVPVSSQISWSGFSLDFSETFWHEARFEGAFFYSLPSFVNAVFTGWANFKNAQFLGTDDGEFEFTDFTNAEFQQGVSFESSFFSRSPSSTIYAAYFQEAKFGGYSDFSDSYFQSSLFKASDFTGGATWEKATLGDSMFTEAQFDYKPSTVTSMTSAKLPSVARCSSAKPHSLREQP